MDAVVRVVLAFLACLFLAGSVLPVYAAGSLRILLTNDDGFEAPGIQAVRTALLDAGHEVYTVAPASQQSGTGAAITRVGVKVTAHPGQVWAVDGTPADAVRFGLGNILYETPPDLVVAGANLGQNAGRDVVISGTVGAAVTAHQLGFPSIAVSVGIRIEERALGYPSTIAAFRGAARTLVRLISNMDVDDLTSVLNINYPPVLPLDVRGVRWTGLSEYSVLGQRYTLRPDGYYRPELQAPNPNAPRQDAESMMDGFITLTFIDGDMSTPVKRSQRYLERDLLDRDYEPTRPAVQRPVAAPVRQPVPARADEPAQQRAAEVAPAPVSAPAPAGQPAAAPEPEPEVILPAAVPEPTAADPLPKTHFEHRVAPGTRVTTEPKEGERAMVRAEDEEKAEERRQQDSKKKKPDSWLRRMFDPDSWRR